ncbi:hypothetical protein TWF694_006268 [Orbilia ellipsospora]|uniref:Peptidase S8/S53 domain-containing protein n=1 Tax=Orbilia ellipsospora TaxID=2528407 RepID=A0AAV9XK11_9PEZI
MEEPMRYGQRGPSYLKRNLKKTARPEELQDERTKTILNDQKEFLSLLFGATRESRDSALHFLEEKVEKEEKFLETCVSNRNLLYNILNKLRNAEDDLPEDISNIEASIDYIIVKKPSLLYGKDIRESTVLNTAAEYSPAMCIHIINILIPEETLNKIKSGVGCRGSRDGGIRCPLFSINKQLRKHAYRKNIGKAPVLTENGCFHDILDLKILESKNEELKAALKEAILPHEVSTPGNAALETSQGKSLLENILNAEFLDTGDSPEGSEFIKDQLGGFRSLVELCTDEVFKYRNKNGRTPLQQAIVLYQNPLEAIDWNFLHKIIKIMILKCPGSIYHSFPKEMETSTIPQTTTYSLLKESNSLRDKFAEQVLKAKIKKSKDETRLENGDGELRLQGKEAQMEIYLEWRKRTEYLLKLTCIGDYSKSHTEKINYLYSNNQPARLICLNLSLQTSMSLDSSYVDRVRGAPAMEFEEILESVCLPQKWHQLENPNGKKSHSNGSRLSEDNRKGQNQDPYIAIFEWLRKDKRVQKILRVEVDEIGDAGNSPIILPHSNYAIRKCLQGFDIEELDWKKFDICGNTIFEAVAPKSSQKGPLPTTPALKRLHLYSSGNTAVLRGWANDDSLAKLQNLEEIVIHICASNRRDKEDCEAYLETLEAKLRIFHPSIKVTFEDGILSAAGTGRTSTTQGVRSTGSSESKSQWVDRLKNFRECIQKAIDEDRTPRILKNLPTVKVAVLDDGINFDVVAPECITDAKAFCYKGHPYCRFDDNHGTITASLVREVCPDVELYIARLDDTKELSRDRFHIKSAAEAIEWAIDKGVDIISMSWSFAANPSDTDKKSVKAAIHRAASKNILLFASMPDKGPDAKLNDYWPVGLDEVIRIGSATLSGQRSLDNWSSESEFIFPGEDVALKTERADKEVNLVSGSSVSTALASGLAALVLFYMRAYVQLKPITPEMKDQLVAKAKSSAGMKAIFKALSPPHPTWRDHFVRPYRNPTFDKSVGDRGSEIASMITDVGTLLADKLHGIVL